MKKKTYDRITGILAILLIAGALTLAGAILREAEGREVVCMPSVEQPTPGDETRKIPTSYTF